MIRRITDHLYVGNANDAVESGEKYDNIVSLATPPKKHVTENYLLNDGEHDYEQFKQAVDSVINKLKDKQTVLVHCQAGMSRSVSVCIAAYVSSTDVDFNTAFDKCRHGFQYPASQLLDSARKYIKEQD